MDDRYESEGRKPERERKVVHFIIQGHWRRRSLCVSYLLLLLCRRETHGSLSDLLNISLCFLKMATKCFCFSRSACVNIYVCVSLRGKWGSGSLQEELDSVWVGGWRRRWRPGPGTLYTDTPCTCMYVVFTGRRLLTGTWRGPKLDCRLLLG